MTSRIALAGLATLLPCTFAACSTAVESPSGKLGEPGERLARTLCPVLPTAADGNPGMRSPQMEYVFEPVAR